MSEVLGILATWIVVLFIIAIILAFGFLVMTGWNVLYYTICGVTGGCL